MGINLGAIIKDGRDIYGDGVNVAARLGALAGKVVPEAAVQNIDLWTD
jgi:class 3 adenylate cyclase